jgi:hypothetical protein
VQRNLGSSRYYARGRGHMSAVSRHVLWILVLLVLRRLTEARRHALVTRIPPARFFHGWPLFRLQLCKPTTTQWWRTAFAIRKHDLKLQMNQNVPNWVEFGWLCCEMGKHQ